MCVLVRAEGAPVDLAVKVRQELHNMDPTLPVVKLDTIEEQFDDVLVQERRVGVNLAPPC
jgi:hypothetical protein